MTNPIIQVYNTLGQLLAHEQTEIKAGLLQVNLSVYENGVYTRAAAQCRWKNRYRQNYTFPLNINTHYDKPAMVKTVAGFLCFI